MELFDPTLTDSLRSDTGCHSLQRTNVRLSANIKYVYDGDSLYLESINSSRYLSSAKFKGHKINQTVPLRYAVKDFMRESSDLTEWYKVKTVNQEQTKYPFEQRLTNYEFGAYVDTTSPLTKNRFFAPLWVYDTLPQLFCILRIPNATYKGDIKRILKDGKLVKAIDMREGMNKNFDWVRAHINSRDFRADCVQVEYSGMNKGMSYYGFSGNDAQWSWKKESVMNEYASNERMIMEMNNNITNGYSRNTLIHPSLFNFEFTFEDDEPVDGWVQYVGFYVNTLDTSNLDGIAEAILKLNPEVLYITHHRDIYERTIEKKEPYLQVSNKVTGFRSETLPAQAELQWLWIPPKNSVLKVMYENITVYEFMFDSYPSIKAAKKALLDDFKLAKLNQVSLRMFEDGDRFFITAVNTAKQYENLRVSLPSSIRTNYGFKVVNDHDVIVSTFPEEDIVLYNGEQYMITSRFKYKDYFVIRMNAPIALTTVTNLELMSFVYPEQLLCNYIPHKDFDFTIDRSSHYDPVDSDPVANEKYLLGLLADPNFIGGWDSSSGMSLQEYKDVLRGMIREHFKSIDIPKEFALKDLDRVTLEATATVPNEYMRLEESTNVVTKNLNKITPFITKWAHSQGTNVYARPYDLNLSLALRYDNFAPSYSNANRDLRTHTHSWYIIGEGLPPYLTNLRKAMGYTNYPISFADLVDTEYCAFCTRLTHKIDGYEQHTWSEMKLRDGHQDVYYTFFRGAELEFRGNYEGYKFAAILVTRDLVSNDSSVSDYIKIIDNSKFKTLTILISFYIPDPVLTRLEAGMDMYRIDRSLLYFSNQVYTTRKIDAFGQDVISLDLYNTTSRKTFAGNEIDPKQWQYTDPSSGVPYYYIRKGDAVRWNGNFQDILEVGDAEFSWRTVRDDGSTIVQYWAVGIVEVGADYFWCGDIQLSSHRENPLGETRRSFRIESLNWAGNNEGTLLDKDNEWYMSDAISYYNSIYDIIVSARTNTNRYKQISFGALANILNNYAIKYVYVDEEKIVESEKRLQVYEPSYFPILNSIKSENSELIQFKDQQLMIPIYRYSGTYSPIFRTIYRGAGIAAGSTLTATIDKINTDKRYIKKYATREISEQIDIEDRDYTLSAVFDKTLKLYQDETNYTIVNRNADLNANRSFLSTVFKYPDTFEIIADTSLFDLRNLTQPLLLPLIADYDFVNGTTSQANLLEILKVYVGKSTITSMLLEDVQKQVYTDFYLGTLMKMYTVDEILSADGKVIQYEQKNTFEYQMEANYGRVILKRHQ